MALNIDLSKIRDPRKGRFDSIEIGPYMLTIGDVNNLILKTGDNIIAEYKNGDWLLNGYSIESMWKCLENHYEALKQCVEQK